MKRTRWLLVVLASSLVVMLAGISPASAGPTQQKTFTASVTYNPDPPVEGQPVAGTVTITNTSKPAKTQPAPTIGSANITPPNGWTLSSATGPSTGTVGVVNNTAQWRNTVIPGNGGSATFNYTGEAGPSGCWAIQAKQSNDFKGTGNDFTLVGTAPCVTVSQPQPVTHTLTVTKTGTGTGTVTSNPAGINCGTDCSESYTPGTSVTLTAAPAANSSFAGWSGGGCSGTGTCTVTMDAAKTVNAQFSSYTLSVTTSGTGAGTVTSNPAGINCGSDCSENYPGGTSVTLTASPASGSSFAGWSGGGCSGINGCTVSMDSNKTVNAQFDALPVVGATNCPSDQPQRCLDAVVTPSNDYTFTNETMVDINGAAPGGRSIQLIGLPPSTFGYVFKAFDATGLSVAAGGASACFPTGPVACDSVNNMGDAADRGICGTEGEGCKVVLRNSDSVTRTPLVQEAGNLPAVVLPLCPAPAGSATGKKCAELIADGVIIHIFDGDLWPILGH